VTIWTTDELDRIGAADELDVTANRTPVPIWVVRAGDDLYVRSWKGAGGSWYRAARARGAGHVSAGGVEKDVAFVEADPAVEDAVDAAYREKYGRYPSYVAPMGAAEARATTLKLVPR
jgi:hypothetical protein